jgi:SAM-dependent methyltransferase
MAPIAEFTEPRLVAIYDTVNAYRPGTQPDFCRELASELGAQSIVDLGCGTGIITRALAGEGYRMTGVDPSAAMLERARRGPSGDRVHWICGEASCIGTPGADLAIMTGHVAQFFLTNESWDAALRALHAALVPGGRLAFESRNPVAREWEHWSRATGHAVEDPDAGPVETWTEVDDERDGIVSYAIHYLFAATGDELVSSHQLRFRTRAELTDSLDAAGFAVEHVYGDWDRRPAGPTTPELIVVAFR